MKKLISVLVVAVSLIFVFTACGNNDTGGGAAQQGTGQQPAQQQPVAPPTEGGAGAQNVPAPAAGGRWEFSPDNPVDISILIVTNHPAPAPDNKISAFLRDRLGVTLHYEIVSPGDQATRVGTLLASGILPDILATSELEARLTQGNAKLRLDPFIDSGNFPNIAEHVAPYRRRLSWTGGGVENGIYTLPNFNRFYGDPPLMSGTHYGTGFFIQKSVLSWHGYPDLSNMTLERYFQLISEYKEAHPMINGMPTIGFSFPTFPGRVWGMTNPPMFLAGHPNNGGVLVENGVARIYANTQYAQDYFRFLNQMHAAGIVDPEVFTLTQDQYFANLGSGRVLGVHDQRWAFGIPHDALMAAGMYERTFVPTMPTFEGRTPWYADRDVMNLHQGFSVSYLAENPEMILSFIDLMMSEEWQIILSWGIEGEDFYVGDDGLFYRSPQQRADALDTTWQASNRLMAFFDMMPKRQGTLSCGNAFTPGHQPREFFEGLSDFDRAFLDSYGKQTWRQFMNDPPPNPVYYPAWNISLTDGSPEALANSQLEEAALMFLPGIIMGDPANFDTAWAEYLAHIDLIDVAIFEAAMTQAIQYRIDNWS